MKNEQKNIFQNKQRRIGFLLFLACALFAVDPPRAAAVGSHLDTTFNSSGLRNINLSGNDYGKDVAVQANGKIVVAGEVDISGTTDNTDFAVARLNANGLLDTTFNGNGTVITPVLGDGSVYAVAIQADGKIVVAGSAVVNGIKQFCLVRYNPNGSLDTSFDGNGIVYTLFEPFAGENASEAHDVTVQTDGKIVAAGNVSGMTVNMDFRKDWVIARYNTNGSLDTTFDGDGKLIANFGGQSSAESVESILIQSDGKILAAGGADNENSHLDYFALARFGTDGATDFSFGSSGRVLTVVGNIARIYSIKFQPDGKIVAGGGYGTADAAFSHIIRYNANGSLDSTFGSGGQVDYGLNSRYVKDIAIQPNGKIIALLFNPVSGMTTSYRLNPNGNFDAGFGQGGKLSTETVGASNQATAAALQADGKIVAAGRFYNGTNQDFFVVRYLPESGKPFDFDGDGKTDVSIFRPANGQWWVNRSSNASTFALTFGTSTDRIAPGDFTGDGKHDICFFRPSSGEWYILRSEDSSFFSFPFGAAGDIPAPADFDGDGKIDPAVYRPSTATWYINRSSAGIQIVNFGVAEDKPIPADFDGDGKADIAIWRPSVGQWWYVRSSSGSSRAYTFGVSTDKPVVGDYTGDGRADIAVWRPSNGFWYILRSEDSSFYSFPFGANGDMPAPGDYDGDGRMDAAVFRPSSATWYMQGSTAGTLIQGYGQNGDRPLPNAFIP